jgi:hypothetical protein
MSTRTVGGRPVHKTRVFREGAYWRWEIVLTDGSRYVDGGNYRTEDAARDGLTAALDDDALRARSRSIYLPDALWKKIEARAKSDGRSISVLVATVMTEYVSREK